MYCFHKYIILKCDDHGLEADAISGGVVSLPLGLGHSIEDEKRELGIYSEIERVFRLGEGQFTSGEA